MQQNCLGSYIAGLIEGSGHIMVPLKESPRKKRYDRCCPKIRITFPIADMSLAKKIRDVLDVGRIPRIKGDNVEYNVQSVEGLLKLAKLINGRMRTPKNELLNLLLEWLNVKCKLTDKLIPLGLDVSDVSSTSWLSGFLENNVILNIVVLEKTPKTKKQMYTYFFLEIFECYPEKIQDYLPVLNQIADFIGIELKQFQHIGKKKKTYLSYCLTTNFTNRENQTQHTKLFFYFIKFPLLSSKFLNLIEWLKVSAFIIAHKTYHLPVRPCDFYTAVQYQNEFNQINKLRSQVITGLIYLPSDQRFVRGYHSHYSMKSCNKWNNNFLNWNHLSRYFYIYWG